ncbi:MAG: hypothetical protein NZ738_04280 [Oceanospirillaceae bacterium]|jgi:uncharacterized glyoxalase superfamily protein PhnB|nr:hypothetical protein [Oceanospirillaceae bacterium]
MDDANNIKPDGATYGRALTGIGLNLLVDEMSRTLTFLQKVLTLKPIYADTDFAIIRHDNMEFMLHSDASYHSNPLLGLLKQGAMRGTGVELRLYGIDPDAAVTQAQTLDYYVLQEATDKPHGLREAYILDPNGYIWVPSVAIHHDV